MQKQPRAKRRRLDGDEDDAPDFSSLFAPAGVAADEPDDDEQDDNEELNDDGGFAVVPPELLQDIFGDLPAPHSNAAFPPPRDAENTASSEEAEDSSEMGSDDSDVNPGISPPTPIDPSLALSD